jgi:hypothetical protein
MSARDRISRVVEKWFLVEPLLFAVWTTHAVAVDPRVRTIRVGRGRVEYNPLFIDALDQQKVELKLIGTADQPIHSSLDPNLPSLARHL